MKTTRAARPVKVTAAARGVTGHAGTLLLAEIADRSGLTAGLSQAMDDTFSRRPVDDRGRLLAHVAVAIGDGADCLSDLATLRNQPELFGEVASNTSAWRVIDSVCSPELRGIAEARAAARARVREATGAPETITIDVDSTLIDSHSDKQDAAPTYKAGYGFHPMVAFLDETEEFLAGTLRPGNAGANDASDHMDLLDKAVAQLPGTLSAGRMPGDEAEPEGEIYIRADSGGATHDLVDELVVREISYSIGFPTDERVRLGICEVSEFDWTPALQAEGEVRGGAEVVELTGSVDLSAWPEDTRLIVKRERPHPGAQLSLFDEICGYRHQAFITNRPRDPATAELFHRQHARGGLRQTL